MSPGFSMMGSGIYSTTVTREIVCNERCNDCEDSKQTCDNYWEQDFETNDWGNIEQDVTCNSCGHTMTFSEESQ